MLLLSTFTSPRRDRESSRALAATFSDSPLAAAGVVGSAWSAAAAAQTLQLQQIQTRAMPRAMDFTATPWAALVDVVAELVRPNTLSQSVMTLACESSSWTEILPALSLDHRRLRASGMPPEVSGIALPTGSRPARR